MKPSILRFTFTSIRFEKSNLMTQKEVQSTNSSEDFYKKIAIGSIIIAAISVFFISQFRDKLVESYENEEKLVVIVDSLLDQQEKVRSAQPSIPRMNQSEYARLEAKGLNDPDEELIEDLKKNEDIIPHEGRLGGTMGFYIPENIFILNDKWAFAYFEDGHVAGNMLLKYHVDEDGKIEWEVLDSYLN